MGGNWNIKFKKLFWIVIAIKNANTNFRSMDFDFDEYYKKLTNTDLFAILNNAEAYQPSAVEAANKELNLRQLSPIQIEEARLQQLAAKLQKEEKVEKARVLREKMQTAGESFFSSVKQTDTMEYIIN